MGKCGCSPTHVPAVLTQGIKPRYTLAGWPQSRSGRCWRRYGCVPAAGEEDTHMCQRLESGWLSSPYPDHFTDWATQAHKTWINVLENRTQDHGHGSCADAVSWCFDIVDFTQYEGREVLLCVTVTVTDWLCLKCVSGVLTGTICITRFVMTELASWLTPI
jgi:hypothetical protein